MKVYVTYGCGSNLAGAYSEVEAEDYEAARKKIFERTKGKFAFMYTEEEFEGQVDKYNLIKVALQQQVPIEDD